MGEYDKNALNQKWIREENEIISLGVQDQADQSRCLDLYGGSIVNGAVVGIYWRHGGLNQLWTTNCIENCNSKTNLKNSAGTMC